jgi:hypothetical protein|tara:strand:- start:6592 stop:7023 length:432 start_codon:yes stop_codon:yes gene_type:complete
MSTTQKTLDDFLKRVAEEDETHRTSDVEFVDRTSLKAEFGTLYENYIVEGYTSDIKSEYGGTNTAIRLTSPEGEKLTLWVGSYEQDHFHRMVARWEKQGHSLPIEITFARTKVPSKDGNREYNRLNIETVATGEEVTLKLQSL